MSRQPPMTKLLEEKAVKRYMPLTNGSAFMGMRDRASHDFGPSNEFYVLASDYDSLSQRLAAAEAECAEQARLNGIGSEREARLMARIAEAERDAARYRWLRESPSARLSVEIDRPGFGENQGRKWWCAFKTAEQLDDAIDEALSALSSQEQKCETCGGRGKIAYEYGDIPWHDCPRCSPSATEK